MSYTQSQPFDLGFLSAYVVGTGNVIRYSAGDVSELGTTLDTATHYYTFAYAGGLSTVSISLTISPAQALASNANFYELNLGEILAVNGLTPLSSPTGIISVAGAILGDGAQGNYAAGWTETITFQVANANPGRAVFEIDGGSVKGDENGSANYPMTYRMSVDVKSEAPIYATNTTTQSTKNQQVNLTGTGGLLSIAQGANYQQMQLYDSAGTTNGGQFFIGNAAQAGNQIISVFPSQVASTTFHVGAAGGNDTLYVRTIQNDGSATAWQSFVVSAPVDQGPIASASNRSASHNQSFLASSLFSASDPESDTITQYAFWDSTGNGHFVVNGVAQGTNVEIDVTTAQLALTSYQSGSGGDQLYVRAFDGAVWGGWTKFFVTAPLDNAAMTSASDRSASHNQSFAAGSLFSVSDADGDAITYYHLYDSTSDPASGHWVVGGVAQPASQALTITAAQLSSTTFQSGSGSDDLWVQAWDGFMWGPWKEFHVNAPVDHTPAVTASDRSASHNQSFAAGSLFSVSDSDGDAITAYNLYDSTPDAASGNWVVGGVAQGANRSISITAAQLAGTTFQSGSGSDDLWVQAFDGIAWGAWKEFHVNAPVDRAPVVTASNRSATHLQSFAAASLFSVSDADGDAMTAYKLYDSTADATSGHWVVGGVAQGASQTIMITAAQLASTSFQTGSGSDDLWISASDGSMWSPWVEFHVTAPVDHLPVVNASDRSATHLQSFTAASLFSVSDSDGDAITAYQFWDSTDGVTSGHWVLGGVAQNAGQAIDVSAAQLSSASFQSGSGSDDLWVRANDGAAWGAWKEFHVIAPVNHAPVVTATDYNLTPNYTLSPITNIFAVRDSDGDAITKYDFWDSNNAAFSGHFNVGGVAQSANQDIFVDASQLSTVTFTSGSAFNTDRIWMRAYDGSAWSDWTAANVSSH